MEASLWRRLFHDMRRVHQTPEWEQFAGPGWSDQIMAIPVTDRFHEKQGRSIGRLVLESNGRSLIVYLKRHYCLPWWHGLIATIWPGASWSPGLQEWEHLGWAREHGLPVPEALACGEIIGPWGKFQSFLAVKELTGMLPLHQAVPAAAQNLDADTFRRWKHGLAAEMARIAALLHQRQWFHKDLYLCHFYVAEEDTTRLPAWRGNVKIIDLHRLAHHPWTWPLWLAKDLAQLWHSSEIAGVTARDRLSFWRAYVKENPRALAWRWLRAYIRLKVWSYRRHSNRGGRRSLPKASREAAIGHASLPTAQ